LSGDEVSLKALYEKLDWIIQRLTYLEAILTESQQHPEVVSLLRSLRVGTVLYGEPLKTLDRLIAASRLFESSSHRDEISRIIVNTLALKGPQNISQLTREVQYHRGKASRSTIRQRVHRLLEENVLINEGACYRLSS
jgi:hypothetical protein